MYWCDLDVLGDPVMKALAGEVLQAGVPEQGDEIFRRGCEEQKETSMRPLPFPILCSLLQLDSEDAEPNFDEDGQDEYNELHMPV